MKAARSRPALTAAQRTALLATLEQRFTQHAGRHPKLRWAEVRTRLEAAPGALGSLHEMERTGGEPDVVEREPGAGEIWFVDCSAQSPAGRTSLCYDPAALESRKEFKPKGSVVEVAAAMGVSLLTEAEYHVLQRLGEFDTKSSSWLLTPPEIRQRGGALFGDRRYGRVFVYHNGAQSYYSGRGFRGAIAV